MSIELILPEKHSVEVGLYFGNQVFKYFLTKIFAVVKQQLIISGLLKSYM